MTEPVAAQNEVLAAQSPRQEASRTRWQKFRLLVKVVELRLRFILIMAATGLVFAYWETIWNRLDKWLRPQAEVEAAAAPGFEFFCPMHPKVVRGEPGSCPFCGMPLSRRKKGDRKAQAEGLAARVQLSPFQVAQAGIQTSEVAYAPLEQTVTTLGSVVHDETRYAIIASKMKGMTRVEKLFINYVGAPVAEGQPLAEVYSGELYVATEELLIAQRAVREAAARPAGDRGRPLLGDPQKKLQASIDKLKLWGITHAQVDGLLRADKADFHMTILAPMSGHVVRKYVTEGQIVPEGFVLFEIADLSRVWVKAQVYEDQMALVRTGEAVEAQVETYPGQVFPGHVAFVDPELDLATRTLGVRFDLENVDHRLRPGMYATVTLKTPLAETPLFRDRIAAARAAGTRGAGQRLTVAEQKICPVTGARLGSMGEPVEVDVKGRWVWTCCGACPPKVKAQPARYLARLAPPPEGVVLALPESAVIDTGERKIVYVETDPGLFESREVVLGPPTGGQFPVLEGLAPGEKVALRGAFLINAEERLSGGASPAPAIATPAPSSATATPNRNARAPAHQH
jgi:membrane fusion protein, copper/silver efflux system